LLAPFLKRLPCPEQTSAQKTEFVKRIQYYLKRLDLGYIIDIVQTGVLSSRDLRAARVQTVLRQAKLHDEIQLYTDQMIPFIPIRLDLRGKQEHREDAVDLILKIIDIIWKL